jgi:hypothetical protein
LYPSRPVRGVRFSQSSPALQPPSARPRCTTPSGEGDALNVETQPTAPACWRTPLLSALLGLAAFGATYAVVRLLPSNAPPGVAWIPGTEFTMGTDDEGDWKEEE